VIIEDEAEMKTIYNPEAFQMNKVKKMGINPHFANLKVRNEFKNELEIRKAYR
jgi:hypothetical protein